MQFSYFDRGSWGVLHWEFHRIPISFSVVIWAFRIAAITFLSHEWVAYFIPWNLSYGQSRVIENDRRLELPLAFESTEAPPHQCNNLAMLFVQQLWGSVFDFFAKFSSSGCDSVPGSWEGWEASSKPWKSVLLVWKEGFKVCITMYYKRSKLLNFMFCSYFWMKRNQLTNGAFALGTHFGMIKSSCMTPWKSLSLGWDP